MPVSGTNSLNFATGLDNSGLLTGSTNAVNIVSNMARSIAKINPFAAIATTAAAAFGIIANQAYKLAKEFEQAMKEVETISSATQENFKGISSAVFAMSKITPDGPVKLAKAYYQIVSAGYDGAKGLELLAVAAKAATAGVTTTEVAADGITTVLNAFKLEAQEAEAVADAMFQTVKLGKTTFEQLSSTLSTAAPLAAATGFSYQELLAAVASLTKQGVPTAQAMTQVRSALEAVGDVLGDGVSKTMTFQNALQSMYEISGGSQTRLKELTGRVEAMSAVLGLAGPKAEEAAKDLNALKDAAGSSADAFKRMAGSNINEWTILSNKIKSLTEELGNSVLEISSGVAKFLNNAIDGSDELLKTYNDQRVELFKLEGALKATNEESDEFKTLRKQIVENYPEFLGNIDAERATTSELLGVLDQVNEAYKQRYKFEKRQNEVKGALETQGNIEIKLDDAKVKFRDALAQIERIADEKGIDLKINYKDSDSEILKSVKEQLKDVEGAFDVNISSDKFANTIKGFATQYISALSQSVGTQNKLSKELNNQSSLVDGLLEKNKTLSKIELQSATGRAEAIKRINAAMKESDLSSFKGSGLEEIDAAIKAREAIISQFRAIDQTNSVASLKPFLDSELKEIQEYAKERSRALTFTNKSVKKDDGDGEAKNKLAKELKEIQLQYESYFGLVRAGYKELADSNYEALLRQGEDFDDYLNKRIAAATSAKEKELLILAKQPKQLEPLLSARGLGGNEGQKSKGIQFPDLDKELAKIAKRINQSAKGDLEQTIETEPGRAEKQANDKLINALYGLSDGLYGIADLYTQITGDEETGGRLNQVAGMAEGAARFAAGDYIGGAMKFLTSAISVEIESETAKFQAAIDELNKSIEKLDYVVSKSFGRERVTSRQESINQLIDLEKQANLATEAEKEAEKQIKVLGLTIGKKGKGSGTDQAKLDELAQTAEDARRKVEELKDQLNELYTGTTAQNIADSIIQGFKEGKKSAEDFANDFGALMQNALLQAFQVNYLEDQIKQFYELFAQAGSDGNYTATEIEALRGFYTTMINGAQDDLEAINAILEGSDIGAIGSEAAKKEGLTGAITAITEDTANILAGTLNAMRLDVRQGLEVAIKNSQYLSQIALNTSYNRFLESIDNRFATIEGALLQFQAQG
jgi:hypothetical protein